MLTGKRDKREVDHDEAGRCFLPLNAGPCENYVLRWYYQATLSACRPFVYGGCGGNDNRFESSEACQTLCSAQHRHLATIKGPWTME
uniref:kunitz-like toxin PcKuz3 n=1 Tax=Myxine glutinosa TaxID=7769 RepID=UPI00358E241E